MTRRPGHPRWLAPGLPVEHQKGPVVFRRAGSGLPARCGPLDGDGAGNLGTGTYSHEAKLVYPQVSPLSSTAFFRGHRAILPSIP